MGEVYHCKELRQTIHFWQNCATVAYSEKDLRVPSRVKTVESEQVVPLLALHVAVP